MLGRHVVQSGHWRLGKDLMGNGMGQMAFAKTGITVDVKTWANHPVLIHHGATRRFSKNIAFPDHKFVKGIARMQGLRPGIIFGEQRQPYRRTGKPFR